MKGLILKEVKPGVKRWTRPEEVLPPLSDNPEHADVLMRHAAQYDALAERQRHKGADLDEDGLAQAKEDHLDMVHHMIQHLPPDEVKRLGKLRVMPWDGHNDTLYNPHHHAVFIGSETMAGGYKRFTERLGHMIAHELAHAVDHKDGDSRLGAELEAKLSRAEVKKTLLTPRLRVALHDHHEWAPRLIELALEDPHRFEALHKSLKASHDIDLKGMLHAHLGFEAPAARRVSTSERASKRKAKE